VTPDEPLHGFRNLPFDLLRLPSAHPSGAGEYGRACRRHAQPRISVRRQATAHGLRRLGKSRGKI